MKKIFLLGNSKDMIAIKKRQWVNSITMVVTIQYLLYALYLRILLVFSFNISILLGVFSSYFILLLLIFVIFVITKINFLKKQLLSIKMVLIITILYQSSFILIKALNNWMFEISDSISNIANIAIINMVVVLYNWNCSANSTERPANPAEKPKKPD